MKWCLLSAKFLSTYPTEKLVDMSLPSHEIQGKQEGLQWVSQSWAHFLKSVPRLPELFTTYYVQVNVLGAGSREQHRVPSVTEPPSRAVGWLQQLLSWPFPAGQPDWAFYKSVDPSILALHPSVSTPGPSSHAEQKPKLFALVYHWAALNDSHQPPVAIQMKIT